MVDTDTTTWHPRGRGASTVRNSVEETLDQDAFAVRSDRIVTPGSVRPGYVVVRGERIESIRRRRPETTEHVVDARGLVVVPGLVDLHGDELERYVHPRDAAREPLESAFTACDRAALAAGITTKYHAIAFEDVPERNRSYDLATELSIHIASTDVGFADHRVHARCELSDAVSVDTVAELLGQFDVDIVSMMHHVPGRGQFEDEERFAQRYTVRGADGSHRLVDRRCAVDERTIAERRRRLGEAALRRGTVLASHDDDDPDTLATGAREGVSIAEYPISLPVARRARELDLRVAMGAPNLVRGGSMWGNLAVADAIDAGVVDILCSDYRPTSMLEAAFVETGESLPERIARVTTAPADAVGLPDRGRLEPDARADFVLVDPTAGPVVRSTVVAGAPVYRAGEPLRRIE